MLPVRLLIAGLILMLGLVCACEAQIQDRPVVLAGMHINGGFGEDERNSMLAQRQEYNLRLTFAQAGTGEFLSGVNVAIQATGKAQTTMDPLTDCGPLLFVRLKPGLYRITATYEGKSMSSLLRVKASGTEKVFYWTAT
jgi:hypothetical protein